MASLATSSLCHALCFVITIVVVIAPKHPIEPFKFGVFLMTLRSSIISLVYILRNRKIFFKKVLSNEQRYTVRNDRTTNEPIVDKYAVFYIRSEHIDDDDTERNENNLEEQDFVHSVALSAISIEVYDMIYSFLKVS